MLYCDGVDDFAFAKDFVMPASWHNQSAGNQSIFGVGEYTG